MVLSFLGISKQVEVILTIIFGICFLAFDSSLLHIKQNLEEVWNYDFDPQFQRNNVHKIVKYILCGVIFVRSLTIHLFLAFYIVMLWPAVFQDRPNLMVPWLVLGFIRSIAVNILTLLTGSYVCVAQKGFHKICLDFVFSQILDHGPSIHAWLTVWSYYHDLQELSKEKERRKSQGSQTVVRRRQMKSIQFPDSALSERLPRNSFYKGYLSEMNLETDYGVEHSEGVVKRRSLDSIVLKRLDDDGSYFDRLIEDNASVTQKAMELLNLTEEDIAKVKQNRASTSKYSALEATLKEFMMDFKRDWNTCASLKIISRISDEITTKSCASLKKCSAVAIKASSKCKSQVMI